MTCKNCGLWAPDDPETGDSGPDLCPKCQQEKDDCDLDEYWDRRYDEMMDKDGERWDDRG